MLLTFMALRDRPSPLDPGSQIAAGAVSALIPDKLTPVQRSMRELRIARLIGVEQDDKQVQIRARVGAAILMACIASFAVGAAERR